MRYIQRDVTILKNETETRVEIWRMAKNGYYAMSRYHPRWPHILRIQKLLGVTDIDKRKETTDVIAFFAPSSSELTVCVRGQLPVLVPIIE